MALSASIHKVSLNIADMDRQYYQQHELHVAMHPSETEFRLMVRVIAFAINASEHLVFTKGLGAGDEPELWCKTLSDEIELWVDFGQVDEKRIRKACGRSKQVRLYTYQERKANIWWEQNRQKLSRHKNLAAFHIDAEGAEQLVGRNMQLQCIIDDGAMHLSDESHSIPVSVTAFES
ncbi:MAG: YaeQ family protein [Granulosicoccus sp.]